MILGHVTVLDAEVAKSFVPGFIVPLGFVLDGEILPGDPTTHKNLEEGTIIPVILLPLFASSLTDIPWLKVDPSDTCLVKKTHK